MGAMEAVALMMSSSWASGLNVYATALVMGVMGKMELAPLPETMDPLTTWPVILAAGSMYSVEFFADKIPAVDSIWDSVHTFIRPVGGAAIAYMAVGDISPEMQSVAGFVSGAMALHAHTFKATTRLAINTSPEPFSNSVASVTEDVAVVGLIALAVAHPVIATIVVLVLVVGTIWLIWKLSKFLMKVIRSLKRFLGMSTPEPVLEPGQTTEENPVEKEDCLKIQTRRTLFVVIDKKKF